MTEAQKAAMAAWLDQYAATLLASASMFTRSAYQGFFDQHKAEIVDGMFNAAKAASTEVQS